MFFKQSRVKIEEDIQKVAFAQLSPHSHIRVTKLYQ